MQFSGLIQGIIVLVLELMPPHNIIFLWVKMCVGNALNYSTTEHDQLFHWERMYTHTFMILVKSKWRYQVRH